MCTIITANNTINRFSLVDRIREDAEMNPDGFSMLMILDNGKPLFIRSLDVDALCELIVSMDYNRVFIHTRFATQGETKLENCHGWNTGSTYVFHNGSISARIAERFDVDSMAINHWIDQFGVEHALDYLIDETFANVFLVDLDAKNYIVQRSSAGTLFTDGNGNFSTNSFDELNIPVESYALEQFELDVENTVSRFYDVDWGSYKKFARVGK